MTLRPLAVYGRAARETWRWGGSLLYLGVLVFVPLGLLDALADQVDFVSHGVEVVKILAAIGVLVLQTGSTLLGEVFYSGAVAALLGPSDHTTLSPGKIARSLAYGRLIAADVIYVAAIVVGTALFVVPALLVFVWFGLAAPIIEIERRGVREAFGRSRALVRGRFWRVLAVLGPALVVSEALTNWISDLVHHAIGAGFLGTWMAEAIANVVVGPLFAVTAVVLTLELIELGAAPARRRLRPAPARA